jgi:hypothetical protein
MVIMSPYVELQKQIIRILSGLVEKDQDFLRKLVEECRKNLPQHLEIETVAKLASLGLRIPSLYLEIPGDDSPRKTLAEIILQQVDDSGQKVVIRNLLGTELYRYGQTLSLKEFVLKKGSGENRLRTKRLAQPGSLKKGDILADGSRVLSDPREGGNGSVLIHLTGGFDGAWVGIPARIPIALLTKGDKAPEGLVD